MILRSALWLVLLAGACTPDEGPDTTGDTTPGTQPTDVETDPTDTAPVAGTDADKDGYAAPEDCDDTRDDVFPGAMEAQDGVDNDCDGLTDLEELGSGYLAFTQGHAGWSAVNVDATQTSLTFALWVRLNALGSLDHRILEKEGTVQSLLRLGFTGDRTLQLTVRSNLGATTSATSDTAVPLGYWTHLAVVLDRDDGVARFLFDGVPAGSATLDPAFLVEGFNLEGLLTVGDADEARTPTFDVDDLRLWTHALTGDQIRSVALGAPGPDALVFDFGFEANTVSGADEGPVPYTLVDTRHAVLTAHPWAP